MQLSPDHFNGSIQDQKEFKTTISAEELNLLPLKSFEGKVHVITETDKLTKVIKELEKHEVIGFDTETRPSFKKGQLYKVALIQLAIPHKVYLIRTHFTGVTDEIASLFENKDII